MWPAACQRAPVVTMMHAELARLFASALGLSLSPPRLPLPDMAISLVWHESYDDDPAHAWLRRVIGRLATEVTRGQSAL
jgi:DNA-binding transcriptional LysR family regulator